jgi:hypothetical protein
MMIAIMRHARTLFVTAMVLAIPVYALYALTPGLMRSTNVALADEDDPIGNGMSIVHRRAYQPYVDASKAGNESDVKLLKDWVYTDKGNQSPYN